MKALIFIMLSLSVLATNGYSTEKIDNKIYNVGLSNNHGYKMEEVKNESQGH